MRWNANFSADRTPVQCRKAAFGQSDGESTFADIVCRFQESVANRSSDEVLNGLFLLKVHFYNETFGGDIYPTPVLGMVGLIEDISLVTRSSFRESGDSIVLVEPLNRLMGKVNLEDERAVQNLVATAIRDGLIRSAHDVSEGGLAV